LTSERQRLIWLNYTNFVKEGANLDAEAKEKVAQINNELVSYFSKFSQNLLAEENNQYLALNNQGDFDGLPEDLRNAAMAQAKERNLNVLGVIGNTRSFVVPFLTFSTNRYLRAKVWSMYVKRGDNENEFDNKSTLVKTLQLRAKKAKLLGFPTFAHWNLSNKMAKTPERTLDLMLSVWEPAVAQVHKDVAAMQKIVDGEGGNFKISPWDYRYYSEKVRKEKYDLDQNVVKEYL
jgi:peptidyl-dipeptidase Dcp